MAKQKTPFVGILLSASLLMSGQTLAASETWTFDNKGDHGWNSWSYDADDGSGPTVGVAGYSDTTPAGWASAGDDEIANAGLGQWAGSGIGVTSGNSHAFDGYRGYEWERMDAVLLSFSEDVTLDSVTIGWHYNDYDFSLMTYTGVGAPSDLVGETYAGLLSDSWDVVGHFYNNGQGYESGANITTDISSASAGYSTSYYLLSVLNPNIGADEGYAGNDIFKLLSLSGSSTTPPQGDTPGVPVPATALLFALGLPLLRLVRKRK